MKKVLLLLFVLSCAQAVQPNNDNNSTPPLVLVHFMPWNVAPPISSTWGWHWTMNFFNPNSITADGRRQIASHYYPLTGPYDSMDPDILEYQVLLMKLSGIDGVIVDWYGTGQLWDYPGINDRTIALFHFIEKAGLKFSICYEDQTLNNLISQNIISAADKIVQGQKDIKYLEETWFAKEAYVRIDDKPVLLNFGPQFFKQSSEWEAIFSALVSPPLLFTEDNRTAPAAVGAFSWPPMWKAPADGELTQSALKQYLNDFSAKSKSWPYRISSAFPGFNDIYKEAGVSNGYALLDADNGSTFQLTLDQALSDNPHAIQIVTWNDYGEGTIVEPTEEFGYLYLEMLQDFRRQNIEADFQPHAGHLRMPLQIYNARKAHPNDVQLNQTLDQVFQLFVEMKPDEAYELLKTVVTVETEDQHSAPATFELGQNYPNPFNPQTTISYALPAVSEIKISIFNSAGQLVVTLFEGVQNRGRHQVSWNARHAASGLYFYRLESAGLSLTKKCLLIR